MADYLVFKQKQGSPQALSEMGIRAWDVHSLQKDHTADSAGVLEAAQAAFDGPGRYGVVRIDNQPTGEIVFSGVEIIADETPQWEPPDPSVVPPEPETPEP